MNNEVVYHGSCHANLTELKPFISSHGTPMVYLTTDIVVATIYTVRTVEQFFIDNGKPIPQNCYQFYPYGFDRKTGQVVLDEYYPGAFSETYKNRIGYVYICEKPQNCNNPTNIKCALASNESVKVLDSMKISDVGQQLLEYQKDGLLKINYFDNMPSERKQRLESIMKTEISETTNDNNGALTFIRAKFSQLF